jgi:hypothetical protein
MLVVTRVEEGREGSATLEEDLFLPDNGTGLNEVQSVLCVTSVWETSKLMMGTWACSAVCSVNESFQQVDGIYPL